MKDQLKVIVSKLNDAFGYDYNLISFDSLSKHSLLQIVCDLLTNVGALEEVVPNKYFSFTLYSHI